MRYLPIIGGILLVGVAALAITVMNIIKDNNAGNSDSHTQAAQNGGNEVSGLENSAIKTEEDNVRSDSLAAAPKIEQSHLDKTLSKAALQPSSDTNVNPLAFFVGKVQRQFGSETKLETVNLSDYITGSTVKSINDDLTLNYQDGYLVINTDKAQGIVGFTQNAPKDFQNVKIDCKNEYALIIVVSLDDKELKSSERILIQSMTEEMPLNYTAKTITEARNPSGTGTNDKEVIEKKQIVDIGGGLMQVKEIEAAVVLKGITDGYVAVLDENGYVREFLNPVKSGGNLEIAVPKDAVYIIYSKNPITKQDNQKAAASYIWWEGEDFAESNFPNKSNSPFDPRTSSGSDDFGILSGFDWLSINATFGDNTPYYAKYAVEVSENSDFAFYVRKFWKHGPFKWRFDNQDWQECGTDITLLDSEDIRKYLCANWVYLGDVKLSAGSHIFEIELIQDPDKVASGDNIYVAAFDCFVLSKEPFIPSGKVKPDESTPASNEGYFAFDPAYDGFNAAELDLRGLNEEIAGQSGFVKTNGENFIFPDGEKTRFWGVNTGHDTLNAGNSAIDYLAKSLAKRGVNLIRIHGAFYEIENKKAIVDEKKLEKIHYFINAMKNEGIYVNISIYFPLWFQFGSKTGYPEYESMSNKNPFMLLQFEPDFQAAYKDAVKQLFESVSPHTGVALKDEPAVAFFEIQNEDNYFFWTFSPNNIPDVYLKVLEKMFGSWLIQKYGSLENASKEWGKQTDTRDDFANGIAGLKAAWSMTGDGSKGAVKKRMSDQVAFLAENQKNFYANIYSYLRNDLKVKSLVIAGNWATAEPKSLEAVERYTYSAGDVIDRHGYFEPEIHQGDGRQSYSVNPGDKYLDTTGLTIPDRIPIKFVQNSGMPYMDSEINWTNPNRFRAECPMLLSAYASLSGVDAPTLFVIGASFDKSIGKFAVYTPTGVGQFPAAALMYRNGYIRETEPVVLETLNIDDLYNFKGSFINEDLNLDMFRKN